MVTLVGMTRKKKSGGMHKTPRSPVQIPDVWLDVARSVAAKREQPTVWMLIKQLDKLAREEGFTDLPPLPWEVQGKV